jgi:ABC-type transport system involved in multi-copper enzyme maturation permease subunit
VNTLLQKDFCLYRAPFYTAAVAIVAPWLLAMVAMFYDLLVRPSRDLINVFEMASMFGVVSAIIVAAIFGGFAFSVERRERSSDFLAMLPVSRSQVMTSKFFISLGPLIVLWLIHASTFFLVTAYEGSINNTGEIADKFTTTFAISSAAMIMVFGIAWLMGLFIKSPSISASIGLITLLASGFFIRLMLDDQDPGYGQFGFGAVFFAWAMVIGIVCFLIGALVFRNRVRP